MYLTHALRATVRAVVSTGDAFFSYVSLLLTGNPPTSTFVTDASTNNLQVTINGNARPSNLNPFASTSTSANYGSTNFVSGTDYLNIPSAIALSSNFTIELWFNLTSPQTNYQMICGQNLSGGSGTYLAVNSAGVEFFMGGGGVPRIYYTFSTNTWYHFALVRNGSTVSVYVNGIAQEVTVPTQTGTFYLQYFGISFSTSFPFTGYISNFRVVNGSAVYTSNFTPPTTSLTPITNTALLTCQTNQPVNNNLFLDNSTNNFAITRNGNATQGSLNPYGANWSVLTTNGANLSVPANTALRLTGDFTIEAWIYPTTVGNSMIVGSDNGSSSDFFGITSNRIQIGINNAAFPTWTATWTANTWYHVALTRSSNFLRAFVNGTQLTLASGSATNSATMFQAVALLIGKYGYTSSPAPFEGNISNLRIIKGTALYTASFTPPTAPLTAVTNTVLLTCQSNRFVDNSTNNFTVTTTGASKAQAFSPFSPVAPYSTATSSGSMYFDGTSYLQTPTGSPSSILNTGAITSTTTLTIEAWIYQTQRQTYANACMFGDMGASGSLYWSFGPTSSGNLSFYWYSGASNTATGNTVIPLNTWTHIAVSISAGAIKLFVNGVLQTITGTSTTSGQAGTYNYLQVGSFYIGGASYGYFGYISNLRLVNNVALYTATFTPPVAPLQAISNTSLLLQSSNAAVYDSAMMNDAETLGDAKTSTAVSKFGGSSVAFDGSGDSLMIPASNRYQFRANYTIEFWIYFNSVTGTQDIIGNYVSNVATDWIVIMSATGIQYYPSGSSSYVYSGASSVTTNTWYHVAAVRSGSTCSLYLNGVSVGTPLTFSTTLGDTTKPLYIGSRGGSTNYFNGYMDDLRITNGYARYTQNFTVPTEPFPVQ